MRGVHWFNTSINKIEKEGRWIFFFCRIILGLILLFFFIFTSLSYYILSCDSLSLSLVLCQRDCVVWCLLDVMLLVLLLLLEGINYLSIPSYSSSLLLFFLMLVSFLPSLPLSSSQVVSHNLMTLKCLWLMVNGRESPFLPPHPVSLSLSSSCCKSPCALYFSLSFFIFSFFVHHSHIFAHGSVQVLLSLLLLLLSTRPLLVLFSLSLQVSLHGQQTRNLLHYIASSWRCKRRMKKRVREGEQGEWRDKSEASSSCCFYCLPDFEMKKEG